MKANLFKNMIPWVANSQVFSEISEEKYPPIDWTAFLRPLREVFDIKNSFRVPKDHKIVVDVRLVLRKLQSELAYARLQMEAEKDFPDFQYGERVSSLSKGKRALLNKYVCGICHEQGHRREMEDKHLVSSFHVPVGDRLVPVSLFGIFDGHGGEFAANFASKNFPSALQDQLEIFYRENLSELGVWNALKHVFVELSEEIKYMQQFRQDNSGTTAVVAAIIGDQLWIANVGDSRAVLVKESGEVLQLSEDAKAGDPRYAKGIFDRGGCIAFSHQDLLEESEGSSLQTIQRTLSIFWDAISGRKRTLRVNGILDPARTLGDLYVGKGINPRPKITMIPLKEMKEGAYLILACDGIYEAASSRQIGSAIYQDGEKSPEALAEKIVHSAYISGSKDNLSSLVVKIPPFVEDLVEGFED